MTIDDYDSVALMFFLGARFVPLSEYPLKIGRQALN